MCNMLVNCTVHFSFDELELDLILVDSRYFIRFADLGTACARILHMCNCVCEVHQNVRRCLYGFKLEL